MPLFESLTTCSACGRPTYAIPAVGLPAQLQDLRICVCDAEPIPATIEGGVSPPPKLYYERNVPACL